MTPKATKSSRVSSTKPRSAGGVLGGILGIVAMSAIAGILVTAAVTPVVALTGAAATSAVSIFENLPGNLRPGQLAQPTVLYAKQGDEKVKIAEFYDQDREPVPYDKISPYVIDALVAIEDPRFYTHGGVDAFAASRAVVQNVSSSGVSSGASTITMQYVRNVLVQEATAIPDEEEAAIAYDNAMRQDMDRKLKEMKLAIGVEKKFSKDEIITGYLNITLFGRTVYGIESAAHYYFNTSAKELTLPQAASLVAIVNRPVTYQLDIEENLPANQQRRDLILGQMLAHGKITQAQHDEAVATPVEPDITPRLQGCAAADATHGLGQYCDYVQRQLTQDPEFGPDAVTREFNVKRGGYDIMTTIDLDMQAAAVRATRENVPAVMDGIDVGSATVSVSAETGAILAMAQNRPYSTDPALQPQGYTSINYGTDYKDGGSSGFQVGSTFKPVTLAEWIRTGHSVRDIVNTSGRTVDLNTFRASCLGGVYGSGPWKFGNDNLAVSGNQTVLTAINQSLNGGLVSMQQKMDLCDTFEMAEKLGLHRAVEIDGSDDLSMVPANVFGGTDEMSPLTMASAYGVFSTGGKLCEPYAIESITGLDGEPVPFTTGKCNQAISPEVAAGVAYVLEQATHSGLARHTASSFGIPHLAKTGTTDKYVDNWTVGASSTVATATWVGNADVNPACKGQAGCERVDTRNFGGYGGLTAADTRIWPQVMYVADEKYGGTGFGEPAAAALKQTLVKVPELSGLSYEEAEEMLESMELTARDGGEVDSSQPKGTVARTDPGAGASLGIGSEVTLYRSLGNSGKIPDGLTGQSARDAENALVAANFRSINIVCEDSSSSPNPAKDKVTSVSPGSGSEVDLNTRVTLTVECE